jgi:hypothetical protein
MESDVIKEQLKVLRNASGRDKTACDDAISVLNDYFSIARQQAEISEFYFIFVILSKIFTCRICNRSHVQGN